MLIAVGLLGLALYVTSDARIELLESAYGFETELHVSTETEEVYTFRSNELGRGVYTEMRIQDDSTILASLSRIIEPEGDDWMYEQLALIPTDIQERLLEETEIANLVANVIPDLLPGKKLREIKLIEVNTGDITRISGVSQHIGWTASQMDLAFSKWPSIDVVVMLPNGLLVGSDVELARERIQRVFADGVDTFGHLDSAILNVVPVEGHSNLLFIQTASHGPGIAYDALFRSEFQSR